MKTKDKGIRLDITNLKILELLKKNGRMQNNEIASRLSISEGTVRNRIKKLIDDDFLSIQGLINPDKVNNKQIIFMGVRVTHAKDSYKAAQFLASLDNVTAVYMVTGRYDFIAEVFIEPQNLLRFYSVELAQMDDVISNTESFIVMKSYKKWV